LNATIKTGAKIIDKPHGAFAITTTNKVRQDHFAISINSRPSPSVASTSWCDNSTGDVLLLVVGKRPDLIYLNPLGFHVARIGVMKNHASLASLASINQQLDHRVLGGTQQSRHRVD
jgi:hypothetical protein